MKTIRWQMVMEGAGEYAAPFRNAEDVAVDLLAREVSISDRERFVVYLLDAKHRPIAFETVSIGILDGSLIHPREVFKAAVESTAQEVFRKSVGGGAAAVLLAHNHPSGDPTPSGQDAEVTKRLREAGKILGIPVVDHVIVTPAGAHFSFREKGDWA